MMGCVTRDLGRVLSYHLECVGHLAQCKQQTIHMIQSNQHGPQTGISGVGDNVLEK